MAWFSFRFLFSGTHRLSGYSKDPSCCKKVYEMTGKQHILDILTTHNDRTLSFLASLETT